MSRRWPPRPAQAARAARRALQRAIRRLRQGMPAQVGRRRLVTVDATTRDATTSAPPTSAPTTVAAPRPLAARAIGRGPALSPGLRRHLGEALWVFAIMAIGVGAGAWWMARRTPARVVVVQTPAAPGRTPAAARTQDWVDSMAIPDHVMQGWPAADAFTKSYVPLGSGRRPARLSDGPEPRPSWSGTTTSPSAAPVTTTVPTTVLVRRQAGAVVTLSDLRLPGTAGLDASEFWAVPGTCAQLIQRNDVAAGQGTVTARERGRMGDWLVAIAVPSGQCVATAARAVARTTPRAVERQALALWASNAPLVRGLGAPAFQPGELRDVAFATVSGARYAWGVFRQPVATTQIDPPPPLPQLAFVARETAGGWTVVWAAYVGTSQETLGLAGVLDSDGDGMPEAVFVRRLADGRAELLQVGRTAAQAWAVLHTTALAAP